MRKQPQFLFLALYSLLVYRTLAQCCTKMINQICTQCPTGMHLYRNNCIMDLPNCLTYNDGFDCASCQPGFRLVNLTCQFMGDIYSINDTIRIPQSQWKQLTDEQYDDPNLNQLAFISQESVISTVGRINLNIAYSNSLANQTYNRLVFSFEKGYLEHVYQTTTPIDSSLLALTKSIIMKPTEKVVNITEDPNVKICNNFLIKSNPKQNLEESKVLAAYSEKVANNSIFYRIIYNDADHGLRSFRVDLSKIIDSSKETDPLVQNKTIIALDVNCARKSSIRALENTTKIVFEAYADLPLQESLARVMGQITKCLINPINERKLFFLDYFTISNETTDIFKVTSLLNGTNSFTLIYATVSIDKLTNQVTLIELLSAPNSTYFEESFYVENTTRLQELLTNPTFGPIYKEHSFLQAEIISVLRLVQLRKIQFTTDEGNVTEFVFKYFIKKPFVKKASINEQTIINKDLNQYEYIQFTYRVGSGINRGISTLPITVFPTEKWRQAQLNEASSEELVVSFVDMYMSPLFQNVSIERVNISQNSPYKRKLIINLEDQFIFRKQLVYQVEFFNSFPPKLMSITFLGQVTQNCSPYPNCSQEIILKNLISYSEIQKNQNLTGIIQFIEDQFAPQIENKNFVYFKQIQSPNKTENQMYQYYEAMYASASTLQGFNVKIKIGRKIISVIIVDRNFIKVGKKLLYICYRYYNASESTISIAKRTLMPQVEAFQAISSKPIDDPQLQVQLNNSILTIFDTKTKKMYTFSSPLNAIPLISPIGQNKTTKFDDFTVRGLLEELLGIDRIGKILPDIKEGLFDFNVLRRANFYGAFDQILVSFHRGVIQRNVQSAIINKTSTQPQFFTFQISTPQRIGQTLIPRSYLSSKVEFRIESLLNQNNFSAPRIQTAPVVKFIQKLYKDAKIQRQRSLGNSTVYLILIQHSKFGLMNILADVVQQIIYQIDFQMSGMNGVVKSGNSYQGLVDENLAEAEQLTSLELSRIMESSAAYGSNLSESSKKLKLLKWQQIKLNIIKRVSFTYQNEKYLLEAEIIYNPEGEKNKSINVISFRAYENTKEGFKNLIVNERNNQVNRIAKSLDWLQAERLFKVTQGYYVEGGKIVDIQTNAGDNIIYYTARYQIKQYILEVQLLYSPFNKGVTVLSITPRFNVTPFILPANCLQMDSRLENCTRCKSNFALHRDSTCYDPIANCEAQSGTVCIHCSAGYILLEKNSCL